MEHFLSALGDILLPLNFALLFAGSALGLLVGVLPGLSSPMALALLIPIAFGMEPISAFMILIGVYVGTKTGGAFSAILMRTPGTPAAATRRYCRQSGWRQSRDAGHWRSPPAARGAPVRG